jgi:hypothetical protein
MKAITSTNKLVDELADYVWLNGLTNREVKSIADSINYRIGFPTFGKKAWLRSQLCCLYAFIGMLTLPSVLRDSGYASESEIEEIVSRYVQRLLRRCIAKQLLAEYHRRLELWSTFFDDLGTPESFLKLGTSFYEFLTGNKCDPEYATVLGLRFMRYVPLIMGSIENISQDVEFARN